MFCDYSIQRNSPIIGTIIPTRQEEATCTRTSESREICKACGNTGATYHYGALTCGSCKVFFLRTAASKKIYICDFNNTCVYPQNRCRACRFQRCIFVGMKPEAVGKRKGLKDFVKREPEDDELHCELPDLAVVPYFKGDVSAPWRPFFGHDVDKMENTTVLRLYMVKLEHFCDGDDLQTSMKPNFKCSLDSSLADLILNPLRVCDRTPVGFTNCSLVCNSTADLFRQLYCRMTLHVVDWLRGVGEIWILPESDRLSFIRRQCAGLVLLTCCYNTYRFNGDDLVFCHGFRFKSNALAETADYSTVLNNYSKSFIISIFKELKTTFEEYAALKWVLFFSGPHAVSDEGIEIVQKSRHRYSNLLLKIVADIHPHLSEAQGIERTVRLLETIPHILKLSAIDVCFIQKMVAFDLEKMRGTLTHDLHFLE